MTSLLGLSVKVQRWKINVSKRLYSLHSYSLCSPSIRSRKCTALINFSPFHSSIFQSLSPGYFWICWLRAAICITLLHLTRRPVTYSYIGGCTYALSHPALRHPAYGIFQQHLMNSPDYRSGCNHKARTWTWALVFDQELKPLKRPYLQASVSMHISITIYRLC